MSWLATDQNFRFDKPSDWFYVSLSSACVYFESIQILAISGLSGLFHIVIWQINVVFRRMLRP
jgi:hypothetical protein